MGQNTCEIQGRHAIAQMSMQDAGVSGRDADFAFVAPEERMRVRAGTAFALNPHPMVAWPQPTEFRAPPRPPEIIVVEAEADLVVTGPAYVLPLAGPGLIEAARNREKRLFRLFAGGFTASLLIFMMGAMQGANLWNPLHILFFLTGVGFVCLGAAATLVGLPTEREVWEHTVFESGRKTYRSGRKRPSAHAAVAA